MKKLFKALKIYFSGNENEEMEIEKTIYIPIEKVILTIVFLIVLIWLLLKG